jgi:hypothetical protein
MRLVRLDNGQESEMGASMDFKQQHDTPFDIRTRLREKKICSVMRQTKCANAREIRHVQRQLCMLSSSRHSSSA